MASEELVIAAVQEILQSADLNTLTTGMVKELAAHKLGFDVKPYRQLIGVRSPRCEPVLLERAQ